MYHREKYFESVNIIFIDGLMHNWILKSHCLEFLTCCFKVLFFCFINAVCFCDIAVFAVSTLKVKVREVIYFYTVFMQMLSMGQNQQSGI